MMPCLLPSENCPRQNCARKNTKLPYICPKITTGRCRHRRDIIMSANNVLREKVTYICDGITFTGVKATIQPSELSQLSSNKKAAVIVAHTAIGCEDEFIQNTICELAKHGFVAFALDMFGAPLVLGDEKVRANAPFREDRRLFNTRALAALETVKTMPDVDPARIAAIGYCFGGKTVLDLARNGAQIQAAISFHGVLDRLFTAGEQQKVKARIVAFHGLSDPYTSPQNMLDFVEEMEESGAQYEVRIYGSKVMHGFTRSEKITQEDANMGHQFSSWVADESWTATIKLLNELLRT